MEKNNKEKKTTDLDNRINIGKETKSKLIQVGIDSFKKLKTLGSEQAFLKLQQADPGACLSLLYGLEGAIEGIKWSELSAEKKQELLKFFRMAKKQ